MNFVSEAGHDRVRASLGEEEYARLVRLKDRYDPQNLFRLNQNLVPSRLTATVPRSVADD